VLIIANATSALRGLLRCDVGESTECTDQLRMKCPGRVGRGKRSTCKDSAVAQDCLMRLATWQQSEAASHLPGTNLVKQPALKPAEASLSRLKWLGGRRKKRESAGFGDAGRPKMERFARLHRSFQMRSTLVFGRAAKVVVSEDLQQGHSSSTHGWGWNLGRPQRLRAWSMQNSTFSHYLARRFISSDLSCTCLFERAGARTLSSEPGLWA
jgi:hypothetical protein